MTPPPPCPLGELPITHDVIRSAPEWVEGGPKRGYTITFRSGHVEPVSYNTPPEIPLEGNASHSVMRNADGKA